MTLSIVVITWNGINYLKKTAPKLVEFSNSNTELIYVINGSTDGSVEYLHSLNASIKVIEFDKNMGISIAKNRGSEMATGKYLLMMDDDIEISSKGYLDRLVGFYSTLDNPGFLMPMLIDAEDLDDNETYAYGAYYYPFGINTRHRKKYNVSDIQRSNPPVEISICQGGAMFIKKDIWEELGGFDELQKFNLDDDDISTRANVYGYRNYLYHKEPITHLGFKRRLDKKRYAWNTKTYYSGKARAMVKNFQWSTLLYMFPLSTGKIIAESIYHSIYYRYVGILWANMQSIFNFLKYLPSTFAKRKVIQSNRKLGDKEFLYIKAPKYNRTDD